MIDSGEIDADRAKAGLLWQRMTDADRRIVANLVRDALVFGV